MTPRYRSALAVARDKSAYDLDAKPVRWLLPHPFDTLDVRPGRVILIGAPPGVGKTTLVLQLLMMILDAYPELRAVVGNVETAPPVLLDKLLARLAGVDFTAVTDRTFTTEERERIDAVLRDHAGVLDRVNFLEGPFTVEAVMGAMRAAGANLAVIDYVQRYSSGDKEDRAKLDEVMNKVRLLANAGAAVFVVSSVTRQKNRNGGSTYAGLSLAAFRGSAELEFGADDAYLLHSDPTTGVARLEHVKFRFTRPRDVHLRFCGEYQRFDAGDELDGFDAAGKGGT
jgi:replicative DNA helicase